MRSKRSIFLLLFWLTHCSNNTLATLEATVAPNADTTGNQSVQATINFTRLVQLPSGSQTQLQFTNPEGDQMNFILNGSTLSSGRYVLDGSSNSFNSSFTVTFATGPEVLEVTTTNGFFDVSSVSYDLDQQIETLSANFQMNFDVGGVGSGAIRLQ